MNDNRKAEAYNFEDEEDLFFEQETDSDIMDDVEEDNDKGYEEYDEEDDEEYVPSRGKKSFLAYNSDFPNGYADEFPEHIPMRSDQNQDNTVPSARQGRKSYKGLVALLLLMIVSLCLILVSILFPNFSLF